MASPNILRGGIGGTTGAVFTTVSPLQYSGEVWYVSSTNGSDAASPRGRERIRPLATLAQALTNAGNNDTIVCLSAHQETLTAITTIAETGLRILGEGTGSNRPSFTRNVNDELFDITGAGVVLDNLQFPASSTATALSKVRVGAAACVIRNCLFQASTADDGAQIELITGGDRCTIEGTTVISTASAPSDQPASAILVTNAVSDLNVGGPLTEQAVVLDGGSSGWANPFAFVGTGAITRLTAQNLDLLNDSDITLATGSTYIIHVRNTSGSARLVLAA
jgi:hypothetical protein